MYNLFLLVPGKHHCSSVLEKVYSCEVRKEAVWLQARRHLVTRACAEHVHHNSLWWFCVGSTTTLVYPKRNFVVQEALQLVLLLLFMAVQLATNTLAGLHGSLHAGHPSLLDCVSWTCHRHTGEMQQ